MLDELSEKPIGDKAYDSDPLDRHLGQEYGIEMIAPNRENRSRMQDGRALRRYLRRWAVERLFAWLNWFGRLVVGYEFHAENFLDMVRLGCMKILLRHLRHNGFIGQVLGAICKLGHDDKKRRENPCAENPCDIVFWVEECLCKLLIMNWMTRKTGGFPRSA